MPPKKAAVARKAATSRKKAARKAPARKKAARKAPARKKAARKAPARKKAARKAPEQADAAPDVSPEEAAAAAEAKAAEEEHREQVRRVLAACASGIAQGAVGAKEGMSAVAVGQIINRYRGDPAFMPVEPEDLPLPEITPTEYASKVVAGEIVMGEHVRNACARHLRDLKADGPYRFDEEKAHRAFRFVQRLRMHEGQFHGHRIRLLPWQVFALGSIFGWVRKSDGMRRFRKAWIEGGKGMGKTPILAGVGLIGLVEDDEPGAQVYFAASNEEQAKIAFSDLQEFIRMSPRLWALLETKGDRINVRDGTGYAVPLPWKHGGVGLAGKRPHFAILDEVHETRSSGMMNALQRGLKFRRQGLIVAITNSGESEAGWAYEEHLVACAIAAGTKEDDSYFSFVAGLDPEDGPIMEAPRSSWLKANPGLPVTPGEEHIEREIAQARNNPSVLPEIERFYGCRWGASDKRQWIGSRVWRETVEGELLPGVRRREKEAYLAFLREDDDGISALATAWRSADDEGRIDRVDVSLSVFVPETVMSEPLWERISGDSQGVRVIKGVGITGYEAMREGVLESVRRSLRDYEVGGIATDKASRPFLEDALSGADIELADNENPWAGDLYCREMRRNYAPRKKKEGAAIGMVTALSAVTGLVARRRLRAEPNKVMSAMLDVLRLRYDEETGITPDAAETGRSIVPVLAAFTAIAWAAEDPYA